MQGRKKRMASDAGVMETPSGLLSCYSRLLVRKDVKHFESVRGESRLQDYCKLRLVNLTLRLYNYGHSVLKDYFFPPSYCSDIVSKSTCFIIIFFFSITERPFMVWALIKTNVDFLLYTHSAVLVFQKTSSKYEFFLANFSLRRNGK